MKKNNRKNVERQTRGSLWDRDFRLNFAEQVLNSDDNWLNKVEEEFVKRSLRKRLENTIWFRGSVFAFICVILVGLYFSLRGQKQALIEQISANRSSTETELRTNQPTLEALINSLRAGKTLKHWLFHIPLPFSPQVDQQWKAQVITTLRRAVYQVKERNRWQQPQGEVQDIFLHQDGTLLLAVKQENNTNFIGLWDSKTQQVKPLISGLNASFSPNGSKLAIGGENGNVHFWDVASQQFEEEEFPKFPGSVESITFSPTGRSLALIIKKYENQQSAAYVVNLQSKQWQELPNIPEDPGVTIKYVKFINGDKPVGVFTRKYTETRRSTSGSINNGVFNDAIFWNYSSSQNLYEFKNSYVEYDAKLSFDGKNKAVIDHYKFCRIHLELGSQKPEKLEEEHCHGNFSPDGNQFASAGENGNISLYSVQNGSSAKLAEWKAHRDTITSIKFSSNGQQLITTGADGTIRLWNVQNPQLTLLPVPVDETKTFKSASLSSDGQKIIVIDSEGNASWLDFSNPKLTHPLPGNQSGIISAIFSPGDKQIAIASQDGMISVRDFSGNLISPPFKLSQDSLSGQDKRKIDMIFNSNNKLFAISGYENSGGHKIYSVLPEKIQNPIDPKPKGFLLGLTFDSNGNPLYVGKEMNTSNIPCDGCIYLSDNSGNVIKTLEVNASLGYVNVVTDLYGNLMAIAESDSTVKLWDVLNNQPILQFHVYRKDGGEIESSIKSMSLSADGSRLAIVTKDGKVQLSQLRGLDELLSQGCQQLRDYLTTLDEENSARHLCDGINEFEVNQPKNYGEISIGDKILVPSLTNPDKQVGVEAIASGDFVTATERLNASLSSNPNDPEARIYLNNARIGSQKSYTIAVSVPLNDINSSLEILRGVAQAQELYNKWVGTTGGREVPFKVLIANDRNKPEVAQAIAKQLADNSDVLGVIGHFSSNVTRESAKIYNDRKLVAISPVSTSVELSNDVLGKYVFRTVPSDKVAAERLAEYMLKSLNKTKAVVFYNEQSEYSKSLSSEFESAVTSKNGQVKLVDLSKPNFMSDQAVEDSIRQRDAVWVLMPNIEELDKALQVVKVNNGRLPLLAGDDAYGSTILKKAGKQANGMVIAIPWHIEANRDTKFSTTSTRLWKGDVNWRTAMAYDAAKALIAAIKKEPTREGVAKMIRSGNFTADGSSQNVAFLPSGDRKDSAIQLVKIVKSNSPFCSTYEYTFIPEPLPQNNNQSSPCY